MVVIRQELCHGNKNIAPRVVQTFDDRKQLPIFDPAEEALFKKLTFSTDSLAGHKINLDIRS
jgi:hypothetical protein